MTRTDPWPVDRTHAAPSVPPPATRHRCLLSRSPSCTRGNGAPKRKSCGYCGASLMVERGVWGVFVWTSSNRYPIADASSTHRTEAQSRKAAESLGDAYVWRFVS